MTTRDNIITVTESLRQLLLIKNERYGDSALNPINIFNKQDAKNSILVRLDDKINRIKNSDDLRKNDVYDVMGYLVLLSINEKWFDYTDLID